MSVKVFSILLNSSRWTREQGERSEGVWATECHFTLLTDGFRAQLVSGKRVRKAHARYVRHYR